MDTMYSSVAFFSEDKKKTPFQSTISKILSKTQEMTSKELQIPFDQSSSWKSKSRTKSKPEKKGSLSSDNFSEKK